VRIIDAKTPFAPHPPFVLALLSGRLGRSKVYEQRYAHDLPLSTMDGSGKFMAWLLTARWGEQPAELLLRKASAAGW